MISDPLLAIQLCTFGFVVLAMAINVVVLVYQHKKDTLDEED